MALESCGSTRRSLFEENAEEDRRVGWELEGVSIRFQLLVSRSMTLPCSIATIARVPSGEKLPPTVRIWSCGGFAMRSPAGTDQTCKRLNCPPVSRRVPSAEKAVWVHPIKSMGATILPVFPSQNP